MLRLLCNLLYTPLENIGFLSGRLKVFKYKKMKLKLFFPEFLNFQAMQMYVMGKKLEKLVDNYLLATECVIN